MPAKSDEHRLRVLQHQARLAAAEQGKPDPQLKIPLIVEVRGETAKKPRPRRARGVAAQQPGLDGIEPDR